MLHRKIRHRRSAHATARHVRLPFTLTLLLPCPAASVLPAAAAAAWAPWCACTSPALPYKELRPRRLTAASFNAPLPLFRSGRRLDALVCNAAVYLPTAKEPTFTADGFELSVG